MTGQADFKAIKCIEPWKTNDSWPTKFRTKAITPIGKSHLENLKRVYLFVLLPAALVDTTIMFQKATDVVLFKRAKASTPKDIVAKMINQEVDRVLAERDKVMLAGGPAAEKIDSDMNAMGYGLLDTLPRDLIGPGIHSWLSAQITGMWTTFETLSDELWTAALNAHPKHLAELGGGAHKKGDRDKSIRFDYLQKHQYDLSKVMGTIHRNRYSFDRLEGIRSAYTDASFEKDARIESAISDPGLDAISLLRNVIVHSGGAFDDEYLKRSSSVSVLPKGEVGKSIPLDGELIATILGPVITASWNLVLAVDDWLAEHGVEAP